MESLLKKNIENLNTSELWGTAGKYYSDHIKNIYEIFDTDQIVFYHYDDIKNNPKNGDLIIIKI